MPLTLILDVPGYKVGLERDRGCKNVGGCFGGWHLIDIRAGRHGFKVNVCVGFDCKFRLCHVVTYWTGGCRRVELGLIADDRVGLREISRNPSPALPTALRL